MFWQKGLPDEVLPGGEETLHPFNHLSGNSRRRRHLHRFRPVSSFNLLLYWPKTIPKQSQDIVHLIHSQCLFALLHVSDKTKAYTGTPGQFYLRKTVFLPSLLDMF